MLAITLAKWDRSAAYGAGLSAAAGTLTTITWLPVLVRDVACLVPAFESRTSTSLAGTMITLSCPSGRANAAPREPGGHRYDEIGNASVTLTLAAAGSSP